MTIDNRTKGFQAADGKLKVLWLDDKYEKLVPPVMRDLEPWYVLTCVDGPGDIAQLISAADREGSQKGGASRYELQGLPYDIYLTDFLLCDAKDEECPSKEHSESGLHAPSAGFLLGIVTALRWPKHPQCLIPYSGYNEEYGQIWKLLKTLKPPAVEVLWDEKVTKGRVVESETIRQWVSRLPIAEPLVREARDIAALYWHFRTSPESKGVYRVIKAKDARNKQAKAERRILENGPEKPPYQCAHLVQCKKGDDALKDSQRTRLAVLFLLIREHHNRIARHSPLSEEAARIFRGIPAIRQGEDERVEDIIDRLLCAASGKRQSVLEKMKVLAVEIAQHVGTLEDDTHPFEIMREALTPISSADVAQLVDPFPSTWDITLGIGGQSTAGKALERLTPPLKVKKLLEGDGLQLTKVEKIAARQFARELIPQRDNWPSWLRDVSS